MMSLSKESLMAMYSLITRGNYNVVAKTFRRRWSLENNLTVVKAGEYHEISTHRHGRDI